MAKKRKLFGRILAGVVTGGASELVRSKRLRKAVLTGGLSEFQKPKTKTAVSKNQRAVMSRFLDKFKRR